MTCLQKLMIYYDFDFHFDTKGYYFLLKNFCETLLLMKNEYQVKFSSTSVLSHSSSLIFSTFTNMQFHLMVSYLEPQEKKKPPN